jgi:acyl-CoA thioesterase FadM
MNLYIRLIWTMFRSWRLRPIQLGETLQRTLRVLPFDVDINGHMNNGRYLTLVDLMLVEYFVRTGFAGVMFRNGWRPMSGGSFISYRRGLKPFQTYTLRFRLDGTDRIWNYMRFEFLRGERVCAAGYMKGAAVAPEGFVLNAASYAALGQPVPAEIVPEPVRHWLNAEEGVVRAQW